MHPDHLDFIRKIMNVGMFLICLQFVVRILKAAYYEFFWLP